MILSDREIQEAIRAGQIIIDPPPGEAQYTTSALDLIFGEELYQQKTEEDLRREEPRGIERPLIVNPADLDLNAILKRYAKPFPRESDGSFLLPPQTFVTGITRERVRLPKTIAARVEGRSTLARLGLAIHLTAPTIHAGFSGNIVLEMYNFGNLHLRLIPGELAICQLIFEQLGQESHGRPKKEGEDDNLTCAVDGRNSRAQSRPGSLSVYPGRADRDSCPWRRARATATGREAPGEHTTAGISGEGDLLRSFMQAVDSPCCMKRRTRAIQV